MNPYPDKENYPAWVLDASYVGAQHPQAEVAKPIANGANCQRYAYAFLGLHGIRVPQHRSSDLWEDEDFRHPSLAEVQALDLVLFNNTPDPWGAHVAVSLDADHFLHLSREVGKPAVWALEDFLSRPQYKSLGGIVRVPSAER